MFTNEQIQQYLSTEGLTDAQIAQDMTKYGVTPEQMSSASGLPLSDVQSRYTAAMLPTYEELVTKAYADIGRSGFGTDPSQIDPSGYEYWLNTLKTGAATPEDFRSHFGYAASEYAKANPESEITKYVSDYLVDKAYQDVLGRAPETEGEKYWQEQIISGKVSPLEIQKAVAYGAQGLDRLAAQKYLGEEYFAPEEFLTKTKGLGYQEVVDYVAQNIDDPTKVYQRAQEFNVDPEDVYSALQAKGKSSFSTLSEIENFFTQGQEGFADRYNQIFDETFGQDEERQRLEKILGMPEGALKSLYDPSQFSKSSLETIEEKLQTSQVNKIQDALIAKSIARDIFKYSPEELTTVVSDLVAGKEDDPVLKEIFNSLKSGNQMTKDELNQILTKAAVEKPDSKVFQDNPDLLQIYTPVGDPKVGESKQADGFGRSGQYGYMNGMPIIHAGVAKQIVGENSALNNPAGQLNDELSPMQRILGLQFGSWTESTNIRAGNSVVGIDFDRDFLSKIDEINRGLQNREYIYYPPQDDGYGASLFKVTGYTQGSEGETIPQLERVEIPKVQGEEGTLAGKYINQGWMQPYADPFNANEQITNKLNEAAAKVGIDPSQYASREDLYDAISDKTKGLYFITGSAGNAGLMDPSINPTQQNHFGALYKEVNDKLIPVKTDFFHFDPPKKKSFLGIGGDIGEMLSDIATIPGIAELTLLTPAAAYYPAIKAVQTAGLGGDIGDILKAGALSAVGQYAFANIAPELTAQIGNQLLDAGISVDIAGTLAEAGARTAINAGMSALAGADIGESVERSLLSFGLNKGISGGLSLADFPEQYQPQVAQLLTQAVITGNFENAAKSALMNFGSSQLKSLAQQGSTQPETVLKAARGGLAQSQRQFQAPRRVAPIRRDVRKLIPLRRSGLSYVQD